MPGTLVKTGDTKLRGAACFQDVLGNRYMIG